MTPFRMIREHRTTDKGRERNFNMEKIPYQRTMEFSSEDTGSIIYANSEPQPNAKHSCAASVAIAR